MSKINSQKNLLSLFHNAKVKGPVLEGEVFDQATNCRLDTLRFSVSNHSGFDNALPFGVFGEVVNEINSNLSQVMLKVHPTFWEGEVLFVSWTKPYSKYSELICGANELFEVVPMGTAALNNDANIWESVVDPIDNVHSLRRTVYVTGVVDQIDDREVFSQRLGVPVRRTSKLVNVPVAPYTSINGNNSVHVYQTSVRCGWWLQTTETFSLGEKVYQAVSPLPDWIFYEVVPKPFPLPTYGTEHVSAAGYKLCHVQPADNSGQFYEFYYASVRGLESPFNFEYSEGGLTLIRSFVCLRTNLVATPGLGNQDSAFVAYKFATRDIKRFDDPKLDGLFVLVRHIYSLKDEVIGRVIDSNPGWRMVKDTQLNNQISTAGRSMSKFGELGWENTVERAELSGVGNISTEVQQLPYVRILKRTSAAGIPETPVTGNGTSRLVFTDGATLVYENTGEVATARPGPAGNQRESEPYLDRVINKRFSTDSVVNASVGQAKLIFNDGAISIFEIDEHAVTPVEFNHLGGKEVTPLIERVVQTRYSTNPTGDGENYQSSVAYADRSVVIYKVDSTTITSRGPRTYPTIVRDTIPSVLQALQLTPIARKDKQKQNTVYVQLIEGYAGSFAGQVTEFFTKDTAALSEFIPFVFRPAQISYNGATLNVSIGETLHEAFSFYEQLGTDGDPTYEVQTIAVNVLATQPTTIPTGFVNFAMTVEPFEDGYIVRQTQVKYQ